WRRSGPSWCWSTTRSARVRSPTRRRGRSTPSRGWCGWR
ncbi:MAG: hypothetical protein AVDCRST_MAG19-4637, partial [uncultured Thermomicrobiales bacterium]